MRDWRPSRPAMDLLSRWSLSRRSSQRVSYVITRFRPARFRCFVSGHRAILFTVPINPEMPVRRRPASSLSLHLLSLVFLLSNAFHVTAQDSGSFDCHVSVGDLNYDLSVLGGTKVLTRTRESPPSTYVDELRFDLCADLTVVEGRTSEDQVCSRCNGSLS